MIRNAAWVAIGSFVTVAALANGTYTIVGLLAHEMETRTVTVDAAGIVEIDVGNDAGSVTIETADVDQITVRARIGHGLRRSGSSVRVEGDRLLVRGSCPVFGSEWCDVRYTIEVPERIDVTVRADNDGIRVSGIEGAVELHSDNGSIDVSDIVGDVVLSSDNGSIRGSLLTAETLRADADNGDIRVELAVAPRSVEMSSDNGNVVVVIPPGDETYAVDITTDNGGVDNSLRTDPASDRHVVITSDNGNVTARYPG
jgi:hypothetical protein